MRFASVCDAVCITFPAALFTAKLKKFFSHQERDFCTMRLRPRKLDAHQRQEALERLANGETLIDVARTFAVDPTTIGRLLYSGA
jgi:hypothetical protein